MNIARDDHRPSPLKTRFLAGVVGATTVLGAVATATASSASAAPAPAVHVYRHDLSKAQIAAYSKNQNRPVIVLLRDQFASTLGHGNPGLASRARTLARSQQSIRRELVSLGAPHLRSYHFINALAATVSAPEAARLAGDPAVLAVVPDRKVALPASTAATTPVTPHATEPVNRTPGICGTPTKPLLQPQALGIMQAQQPHYGANGAGVKIAVFPDGLQTNIPDYIRTNGQHAIFDYRDFTGDGLNAPTGGGEAFGDASSLIAQGRQTFDLSKVVNPNLPLPKNCDIRIKGVAPAASVAVMKVFGFGGSLNSVILQGLDWAVWHDHVDVLSESFGGNPVGDPGTDPVALFDSEAVAHGISVVASSGDAGVTNTIGSPASVAKGIISVAASTAFQDYAQLSEHGYRLGHFKGYENNNVAAFSSSGFTEDGPNSVDVIAPGFGGWADCSPNTKMYVECANSFGATNAPPVEDFGGTSQSCPLTAGVVALVIQAYRATHGGQTPSPSVVKTIITSTAGDLGIPAQNQGAGLVNAFRAVQMARSFELPKHHLGSTLYVTPRKIFKTASANTAEQATVTVRNTGAVRRTVRPVVRHFGSPKQIMSTTVTYDPASPKTPTFTYWIDGKPEPYVEHDFTVPAGFQRLNVRLGYPANPQDGAQTVTEVLFDPSGKVASDSTPQGAPLGFSQVEVRHPEAGKWRAIYFSRPGSDKYSGTITISATVQKLLTVPGVVSPAAATLAPGQSQAFTVRYRTPATPGDDSATVTFGTGVGAVPILTRSLVHPTVQKAGRFSGVLNGGNGREPYFGQELTYEFAVPKGVKNLDVDVQVADPGYTMFGSLVDPLHSVVDNQDSLFTDFTTSTVTPQKSMHLSWRAPMPGIWQFDVVSAFGSSSGKTGTPLTGTVAFNTVDVSTTGIPRGSGTVLKAGTPYNATITVKNTGNSPEIYYVDPRQAGKSTYSLGFATSPNGTLPISGATPQAIVPPASTSLTMVANASKPVTMTMSPTFGSPEILSTTGRTAVANLDAPDVAASEWGCGPAITGPFARSASGTFSCAAFATTDTINDTVQATGGNLWDSATDPNSSNGFDPSKSAVVPPGGSTTLQVTFTPTASQAGTVVSGYLEVQNFNPDLFGSDQMARIPYVYTVGS